MGSSTYEWIILYIREQAQLRGYFTYSSLEALPNHPHSLTTAYLVSDEPFPSYLLSFPPFPVLLSSNQTSTKQELINPSNLFTNTRLTLPRLEAILQLTSRIQRLTPDLFLHIPSKHLHYALFGPPHTHIDLRSKGVGYFRGIHFVSLGMDKGWSILDAGFGHGGVVEFAEAVIEERVMLHGTTAFEFVLVIEAEAQGCYVGRYGVVRAVKCHGGCEVGFFVALAHCALREEGIVVGWAVVVVIG